jgi:hypothetical protein
MPADPRHAEAPMLDQHPADFSEQGVAVGRPHDGLVDLAERRIEPLQSLDLRFLGFQRRVTRFHRAENPTHQEKQQKGGHCDKTKALVDADLHQQLRIGNQRAERPVRVIDPERGKAGIGRGDAPGPRVAALPRNRRRAGTPGSACSSGLAWTGAFIVSYGANGGRLDASVRIFFSIPSSASAV